MFSNERFTDFQYIGEGGMGTVYKVFDHHLGKTCALKLYKHSLTEAETKVSMRESALWFTFRDYGHVVEVYEILEFEPGKVGILMEYIDQGNLRSQLNAGTLSIKDKILALFDISCALMSCLKTVPGFCHLDIKPQNCLRTRYGLTKLTDFGLALAKPVDLLEKSTSWAKQGTHKSMFVRSHDGAFCAGTPLYMSPEQIIGCKNPDERSDVYALGVMALELLSGKHPLADLPDVHSVFNAHLKGSLGRLAREFFPSIFALNSGILINSLDVDPGKRPTIAEINSFLFANLSDIPLGYLNRNLLKLPDPVDETLRTARSLWTLGRSEEAIKHLHRNLVMDPFQADSWYLLAQWNWTSKLQPMLAERLDGNLDLLLQETCIYAIRALILDKKYSDPQTQEGLLVGVIIPQMAFQLTQRKGNHDKFRGKRKDNINWEEYTKWVNNLVNEQSIWLKGQERRIEEVEGKSRCLCIRCGEVKMYIIMRCPRCGFLPTDIKSLYITYLTNLLLKSGMRNSEGVGHVPYQIRMNYLRQMGKNIDNCVDAFINRSEFKNELRAFSKGMGAKLLDMLYNGPNLEEMKRLEDFHRHIKKRRFSDKVRNFFGFFSKKQ